ncbi:hypothetical protein GCM10023260_14150 [Bartonella acomydis]|uniref:Uncharacterized protein n=1 Tax=Bartonella acomydis TaxID=686234 RepID=A0ABP9N1A0_9HYPH
MRATLSVEWIGRERCFGPTMFDTAFLGAVFSEIIAPRDEIKIKAYEI